MTGRDLIIYIMENGLEDKSVFENDTFLGFMTEQQFAEKMCVGVATVRAWIDLGYLSSVIRIGDTALVPTTYSEWNPMHAMFVGRKQPNKRSEEQ